MTSDNLTKNNWPLIGNQHITSFLERSIANNKVNNAYIFLGPNNLGKTTTAVWFAKSLLCENKEEGKFSPPCEDCPSCRQIRANKEEEGTFGILHGDFHLIKREEDKKNVSIEQIRELIKMLSLSSFLGSYKIGIIKNAESLSEGAANALLKTLEEPREKVVIILVASCLEDIPATIASRSQTLNFYPVESGIIYDFLVENLDCQRSLAKNISRLSLGRPALAIKFFEDKEFYKNYLLKVDLFLNFFNQNINERFREIEKFVGKETFGRENVKKSLTILAVWQGLVRDLLLIYSGRGDLIQHEVAGEKLKQINKNFNKSDLLALNKFISFGENYIKANVSPKLVLEDIACNL